MTGISSADEGAVVFILVIVFIMARRTYALSQGTVYSTGRVFGYGAFSTFLFAVLAASTIYVAATVWGSVALALIVPYIGVIFAAAAVVEPHVRRRVTFERRDDGRLYYRLPVLIPVLSLVLFVVRVGVDIGLFGLATLTTFTVPASVSSLDLAILIGADLVYGTSIGLLYGRGLGVRSAYLVQATKDAAPLPS